MFEKEPSEDQQKPAELNRRKPENRWRRISRDAEWDQNEPVRWWLKLARQVLRHDENTPHHDEPAAQHDEPALHPDEKDSGSKAA